MSESDVVVEATQSWMSMPDINWAANANSLFDCVFPIVTEVVVPVAMMLAVCYAIRHVWKMVMGLYVSG